MTPNPFRDWLPMYDPNSVPERPWWQFVSNRGGLCRVTRCDGAPLTSIRDLSAALMLHTHRGEALAVLAAYDVEHPLPAPPPMGGQVWVSGDGLQRVVTELSPESMYEGHDSIQFGRLRAAVARAGVEPVAGTLVWPPAYAVLVAGPSPWGRDRPWAPPGWKP